MPCPPRETRERVCVCVVYWSSFSNPHTCCIHPASALWYSCARSLTRDCAHSSRTHAKSYCFTASSRNLRCMKPGKHVPLPASRATPFLATPKTTRSCGTYICRAAAARETRVSHAGENREACLSQRSLPPCLSIVASSGSWFSFIASVVLMTDLPSFDNQHGRQQADRDLIHARVPRQPRPARLRLFDLR